jgi:serine/threonine-protein kinase
MAQVWVARLTAKHGFEKLVAIKAILPKYASDPQFQTMFLDEARIASGIEHANVARTFDLGDEHGVLYLAMEWVDGDALSKLQRALAKKGETIPPGVLLRIVADTCGGLHAAHELRGKNGKALGVVHRDVSPHNILVSSRGEAKLIDFGIAKARDRAIGDTNAGTLKGKVHYMAPEQALGEAVDRRADIWAVGAVLYHGLSGRPPFLGENDLATLHMLASRKAPAPLPMKVPLVIGNIVKRALSDDREKRFATAEEMQAALEQAMVTCRMATTEADVAAFVAQHLADRIAKRREAVDLALAAAEERARVQELLKVSVPDSSVSTFRDLRPASTLSERDNVVTTNERPRDPLGRAPGPQTPPSIPTAATLGMAAVESVVRSHPGRRRGIGVVAVGIVGIALGIGGTIALRRPAASNDDRKAAGTVPAAIASGTAQPPPAQEIAPVAPASSNEPPTSSVESASAPSAVSPVSPVSPLPRSPSSTRPHAATASSAPRKIPKVIDNGF